MVPEIMLAHGLLLELMMAQLNMISFSSLSISYWNFCFSTF
jgi:hypothetical protein